MVSRDALPEIDSGKMYSDANDISWPRIAKMNFGLDLMWRPPEQNDWATNFIMNLFNMALEFVPVVGPLLQILWCVGFTAITTDEEEETFQMLKDMCPVIDLADHVIANTSRSQRPRRSR